MHSYEIYLQTLMESVIIEKPYACPLCDASFFRKYSIGKHVRIWHFPELSKNKVDLSFYLSEHKNFLTRLCILFLCAETMM